MLAEFSIYPLKTDHLSKDLAKVMETLEGTGLNFRLGPMGTCIEGSAEQVFAAVQKCHEAAASTHERVITTIVLDDRKTGQHHLDDMIASVEQQIGHKLPK